MIKILTRPITIALTLTIFLGLWVTPPLTAASSDTPATATTKNSSTADTAAQKSSSKATYSDADIAAAKASGKVWVNLDSGIYHKRGRWFGKTKNGKFMTPDEAKKAGYRQAKRE